MADNNMKCPNGTPTTKILNSAVASWAGFVYQGLWALCVALDKLLTDSEAASKWFLNLEGYEDFAILDENKHVLSFHQCKDYKGYVKNDIKEECEKMEDKRWYWSQTQNGGICNIGVPLFFHAPISIPLSNGVNQYPFNDGASPLLSMEDVDNKIKELVDKYLQSKNIPGSGEHKHDKLVCLIQDHVSFLDRESKKVKLTDGMMMSISVNNPLPFLNILDILNQTEDSYTISDKVRTSVYYLNLWMNDRMTNNPEHPHEKVIKFLDALNNLGNDQKEMFIRKVFPDIDIDKGRNVTAEISTSPRFDYLYNVLIDTEDLDYIHLHWDKDGKRQMPSTLGNNKSTEELCGKIVTNKHLPPELLRDYDYIVGDIKNSVEDILQSAKLINQLPTINYNNITKGRKVGLLTIEDKNKL